MDAAMKYNIYQKINSGQPVVTCIDGERVDVLLMGECVR